MGKKVSPLRYTGFSVRRTEAAPVEMSAVEEIRVAVNVVIKAKNCLNSTVPPKLFQTHKKFFF